MRFLNLYLFFWDAANLLSIFRDYNLLDECLENMDSYVFKYEKDSDAYELYEERQILYDGQKYLHVDHLFASAKPFLWSCTGERETSMQANSKSFPYASKRLKKSK